MDENTDQAQKSAARARSLANLRPWVPGQPSPNPKGRPRKKLVIEYLEDELEELAKTQGIENGSRLVAKKWAQLLFAGNKTLWQEFLARRDGAVKHELGIQFDVTETLRQLWEEWGVRPAEVEAPDVPELEAHDADQPETSDGDGG